MRLKLVNSEQRGERIGDIQSPQDGEAHPAAAGLAGDSAHYRDTRYVKQDENQGNCNTRRGAAEFLIHHAIALVAAISCRRLHRFDRVSQYAQAKGVFQALLYRQIVQQFIAEVKVGRISNASS